MKEKSYPPGVIGMAEKLLAYDEAEGEGGRVAKTAFILSQRRARTGSPGNPETDWKLAEEIVKRRLAREVVRRLA